MPNPIITKVPTTQNSNLLYMIWHGCLSPLFVMYVFVSTAMKKGLHALEMAIDTEMKPLDQQYWQYYCCSYSELLSVQWQASTTWQQYFLLRNTSRNDYITEWGCNGLTFPIWGTVTVVALLRAHWRPQCATFNLRAPSSHTSITGAPPLIYVVWSGLWALEPPKRWFQKRESEKQIAPIEATPLI